MPHPDDGTTRRRYRLLVGDEEEHDDPELPDEVVTAVPGNAARQVAARALQNAGDVVVDPRTVLAWLLTAVGAPAALSGLLVPIREAGSLLPQAVLVPLVRRRAVRKGIWVTGALGQAVATCAMAFVAATAEGALAGWGVLAGLALFALARSLSSLASKDVLGRTIPRGRRGRITGWSTTAAGIVAVTLGLGLRALGGGQTDPAALARLLGVAALAWVVGAVLFAGIREVPGDANPRAGAQAITGAIALLRDDAIFRRFVVARALLLVAALSPPFVVVLAARLPGGGGLAGLGPFVLGSGVAALVGGRVWGWLADRSSRLVMVTSAASAALVVAVFLAALRVPETADATWLYPATYLLLALAHTGARIGRKTYVVDLAPGDRRTTYVAVSNATMGLLLLGVGGLTAALATLGVELALLALAVLGAAGALVGLRLPEVSDDRG